MRTSIHRGEGIEARRETIPAGLFFSRARFARPAACLLAALALWLAPPAHAVEPAAGVVPLLAACEDAPLVVVGTIARPSRLDVSGRAAELAVERVLSGTAQPGASLRIAWEELAQARPDRFAEGDRVLVALGPLPPESLWRQRFPGAEAVSVRAVRAHGDAFLRRPDDATIELLGEWARMPAGARGGPGGADALARIVAGAHPGVALSALGRLSAVPDVAVDLGPAGAQRLGAALGDASRPQALRAAIVVFAGDARVMALRETIEALTAPGSGLEPEAVEALAKLDGTVPADRMEAWLARPDPRVRAAAVRGLAGPKGDARLATILRTDAAPEVRAAAVTTLLAHAGPGAEGDATPALFDADPSVRAAAAQGFAKLGERAVPLLQRLALEKDAEGAKGPIAALGLAGQKGAAALREIVALHPDPKARLLADFALGHVPSHDRGLPPDPAPAPQSGEPGVTPSR